MRFRLKSRTVLGLAIFTLTAASYAQWSNPAQDVPAYHPSAPSKSAPCLQSCRDRSSPAKTSSTPGRSTCTSKWQRSGAWSTSCHATAAATAPSATPACAVALKASTVPNVPPAPRKVSTPTSKPASARLPRRSGPALPGLTTRRSTSTSNRLNGRFLQCPALIRRVLVSAADSHPILIKLRTKTRRHRRDLGSRIP